MPRKSTRASESTVNAVHRLVGKTLAAQLKKAQGSAEGVSAALLNSAISYLKLTEATTPHKPRSKVDRLAQAMPDFDQLELGAGSGDGDGAG
jgi:hypothetical protein